MTTYELDKINPNREIKKKKPTGLKENSKRFLDIIAGQKVRNATKAYKEVYPYANDVTARNNAHHLLAKSSAKVYLQEHVNQAVTTIVELMNTSDKDDIRLRSATDILDRNLGRSVQRTEIQSTGITINVDLSGNGDNLTFTEPL